MADKVKQALLLTDEEMEPNRYQMNKYGGWDFIRWWKSQDGEDREYIRRLLKLNCQAQLAKAEGK